MTAFSSAHTAVGHTIAVVVGGVAAVPTETIQLTRKWPAGNVAYLTLPSIEAALFYPTLTDVDAAAAVALTFHYSSVVPSPQVPFAPHYPTN